MVIGNGPSFENEILHLASDQETLNEKKYSNQTYRIKLNEASVMNKWCQEHLKIIHYYITISFTVSETTGIVTHRQVINLYSKTGKEF